MTIIIKDASNLDGNNFGVEPMIFKSEEQFKKAYDGVHVANDTEPESYPVLVVKAGISSSFSGRDYQHFIFFYDFEEVDEE